MRRQLTKIALLATIWLALAFTFSCSDDGEDPAPVWTSCEAVKEIVNTCDAQYDYDACNGDAACQQQADEATTQCAINGVSCNGLNNEQCKAHYMQECYPGQ